MADGRVIQQQGAKKGAAPTTAEHFSSTNDY
jgi:hypothetical protein